MQELADVETPWQVTLWTLDIWTWLKGWLGKFIEEKSIEIL